LEFAWNGITGSGKDCVGKGMNELTWAVLECGGVSCAKTHGWNGVHY